MDELISFYFIIAVFVAFLSFWAWVIYTIASSIKRWSQAIERESYAYSRMINFKIRDIPERERRENHGGYDDSCNSEYE